MWRFIRGLETCIVIFGLFKMMMVMLMMMTMMMMVMMMMVMMMNEREGVKPRVIIPLL